MVGLGYWGPNLVRNLHESPASRSRAICDLRPAMRSSAIGRRYPARRPDDADFDDVLDDPSIDAVAIATPVSTHHAARAARRSRAGKHVFVEKPLAASAAEARGR